MGLLFILQNLRPSSCHDSCPLWTKLVTSTVFSNSGGKTIHCSPPFNEMFIQSIIHLWKKFIIWKKQKLSFSLENTRKGNSFYLYEVQRISFSLESTTKFNFYKDTKDFIILKIQNSILLGKYKELHFPWKIQRTSFSLKNTKNIVSLKFRKFVLWNTKNFIYFEQKNFIFLGKYKSLHFTYKITENLIFLGK